MEPHFDHVALVCQKLEAVLTRLAQQDVQPSGPIEDFPGEGTREVYVGDGSAKLLLMEPTAPDGPYGRALAKRGPGLHHVAVNAPDLDAFLAEVRGWLLLPASLKTIAQSRTAWLARPGVATLLEVHEAQPSEGVPLVEAVEVPGPLDVSPRFGLSQADDGVWLTIGGRRLRASELAGQ
jgi:methylmalonyl-CoA/ethylmalonyl-CoA epimerase